MIQENVKKDVEKIPQTGTRILVKVLLIFATIISGLYIKELATKDQQYEKQITALTNALAAERVLRKEDRHIIDSLINDGRFRDREEKDRLTRREKKQDSVIQFLQTVINGKK